MFAAFFVPPQRNGVLDAAGYRALRTGTVAAGGVGGLRGAAGAADRLRCVRPAAARPSQPGVDLVGGRAWWTSPGRGGGRHFWPPRWPSRASRYCDGHGRRCLFGGSLVTLIPLGLTGHSSAGGSHDLAHQQPADPPFRRCAVGRRPAGTAGSRAAGRRTRRSGGAAVLRGGALVLRRDGAVRAGQRVGANPARRPAAHRLRWLVVAKVVALCALGGPRLAAATLAAWPRCGPIRATAAR